MDFTADDLLSGRPRIAARAQYGLGTDLPEAMDINTLLGIAPPEYDTTVDQPYQTNGWGRALEGMAGLRDQPFAAPRNFGEGFGVGFARGLGTQGSLQALEHARINKENIERRTKRAEANLQATRDYRKERAAALKDLSKQEREDRQRANDRRDKFKVIDALDVQTSPWLAPYLGQEKPLSWTEPKSPSAGSEKVLVGPDQLAANPGLAPYKNKMVPLSWAAPPLPLSPGQIANNTFQQHAQERQDLATRGQLTEQVANEFKGDPSINGYRMAQANYEVMKRANEQNSGYGDLTMIISFVRLTEPGQLSVVREEEKRGVSEALGTLPTKLNWLRQYMHGRRLTEEGKRHMMDMAKGLAEAQRAPYEDAIKRLKTRAQRFGVDTNDVIQRFDPVQADSAMVGPPPTVRPVSPGIRNYLKNLGLGR